MKSLRFLFLILIGLFFSEKGIAQTDTDGAMRIFHYTDYFYTNNNDEGGTDEHTWYYYRREEADFIGANNAWDQSKCQASNCGGGCYGYPGWGLDRTYNQSNIPTQFRMRGRYWEDDRGSRCNYDCPWYGNCDDDYNNWEQQYNVRQGCPYVWTYYGWQGSFWRNVHYTRTYYSSPRPNYAQANGSVAYSHCGPQTITLSSAGRQCGTSRYYWYRNGTYIGNTTGTMTYYNTGTATFTVYTNDQGANSLWNRSMTVTMVNPPSGSAGSNITQCGTGLISTNGATAANNSSVSWSYSGSSATLSNSGSLNGWTLQPNTPSGSGTLTLTINGNSPCPAVTRTRTVTWHQKASGSAGGTLSQCYTGAPTAITMSGASMSANGNSASGSWSIVGGTGAGSWSQNTSTPQNATFTPSTPSGSLTVRLTITTTSGYCNGQTNTYDRTITWNTLSVNAGAAVSQCSMNPIVTSDASVSGLYTSATWTYSAITGTATLANPTSITGATLTPTSAGGTGTLTLTVVGIAPCPTVVATKDISWSGAPLANAGSTISSCSGSGTAIPMTGATGGGLTGSPTWTGGAALGAWSGSGNDPAAYSFTPNGGNPSGSFTATLTVTGISPCTGTVSSTRLVRWNSPPTASAGGTLNSCNGTNSITLSGATAGGSYGSVGWSIVSGTGSGTFTNGGANPALWSFNPTSASGALVIRLTTFGNGYCIGTNPTSDRTINWGSISANSPATINSCGTGAITMTGSSASGIFSGVAWSGQSGGTWTTTHGTNPAAWVFTPSVASGTFTGVLTVTGSGGCIGQTATSNTVVDWDVTPTVEAGSAITSCTGAGTPIAQTGATAGGQYGSVAWSTSSSVYGTGSWTNGGTNPALWTFTPSTPEGFIVAQLQVNGNGNCSAVNVTDVRTIQWSSSPTISSVTVTNQTDCNNPNGTIIVVAAGNGPLSYSSDGGTSYAPLDTILGIALGSYNIQVQDTVGCTTVYGSNPVAVSGPSPVVASSVAVTSNNLCAGGILGEITISGVSGGGGGPYEFALDGLGSSRTEVLLTDPFVEDSLSAGSYNVVVLDQFGCESVVYPVAITEPSSIVINSLNIVDVLGCGSSGTGSITASASGGTGTLNYYLNGTVNSPATSGSWPSLPGGSYEVMIQDASACQTIAQASINAPWTVTAGTDIYRCGSGNTTLNGEIIGVLPADCPNTCSSGCGIPGHCAAQTNNTSDEWISRVIFNTINNTSGSTTYSNYTGISTTVQAGNTYNLQVRTSKCCGNTSWNECVTVFFDWNRDGTFGGGENYNIGCGTANVQNRSVNITIPTGAALGNTRMRVYHRYAGYPTACATYTYGEVEDYTVNITGTQPCAPTFSWSPTGGSNLTATVNPSSTTSYTLTVNDGDGCIQSDVVAVNVSNQTATTSQNNVDCFGNSNACITLNPTNGIQPYLLFGPSNAVQVYGGNMRSITVNNTSGTAYTNHPVKMTIPYTAGMRADFGDIRFFHSNQAKLSYWIESYSLSTSAVVWVKMPSLPTGNSTIYLTYSNVALTSESDGDDVFEFFDGFNSFDASKWTQGVIAATTGSDWSYYGGKLIGGNTNRIQTSVMTFTGTRISEARTYESSSAVNGFTVAGFFGSTSGGFSILNHNGIGYCRNDNTWGPANFGGWGNGQRNTWIREYIRANGASSYVSRTREIGGTVSATRSNSGLANERIRIGARADNGAYNQNFSAQWDWMYVRPFISVEPSITIGSAVTPDNQFCGFGVGTYNFNVVDVAGCNTALSPTITQPSAALSLAFSMYERGCYAVDGAINLTVTGGTQLTSPPPAYYYTWAGPSGYSSSIEDISGLQSGVYNITVADANACTVSGSATLNALVPLNSPGYTWTGNTNTLWQIDGNWDCRLPDATSEVIIPGAPMGGNNPEIQNGITGNVLNIDVRGNTSDLLDIQNGGLLIIHQP